MRRHGRWLLCLVIWVIARLPAASAATITVDSTADDLDLGPNGNCTLREAIEAANTDAAVDRCVAGSGADTIEIPAGTYTLGIGGFQEDANATGDLDITSDATLIGAGTELSILDGGGTTPSGATDRLLDVHGPVTVEVRDLALQHGAAGWIGSPPPSGEGGGCGLRNDGGSLTLRRVSVRDNDCRSYLELWYTDYAGPGGGIESKAGALVVEDSTIERSSAAWGGGIAVSGGNALIRDSVVRGNFAWWRGGGLEISTGADVSIERTALVQNSAVTLPVCVGSFCWPSLGHGFGLDSFGTVTLVSSTVADNDSNPFTYAADIAAAIENAGTLSIESSTLVLSTVGAVDSQGWWMLFDRTTAASTGVTRLRNSIVDGRCSGPGVQSLGSNLSSDATCGFSAATDLESADPRFAGLVEDPSGTWVVSLEPLSPAIDTGDDASCPAIDQRGSARPIDGNGDGVARCDRGAYETAYQPNGGCSMDPGPSLASAADGVEVGGARGGSGLPGFALELAGTGLALGAAGRLRARHSRAASSVA